MGDFPWTWTEQRGGWTIGAQGKAISQWLQLVSECSWQFGRQTGISVGSLDRVQVCPVPSTAQGLVLLGFAKLAGAGQGQRGGFTFPRFGKAGQGAWLLAAFPAFQQGRCVHGCVRVTHLTH